MDSELAAAPSKRPGPPLQLEDLKKQKGEDDAKNETMKNEEGDTQPIIKWTRRTTRKHIGKKGLNKASPTQSDTKVDMEEKVDDPSSMGSIPEGVAPRAKIVKW